MTPILPWAVRARHLVITSRWQRWLFPALCCLPYVLCLAWLLAKGLYWVAQVMLAPLVMAAILGGLTVWLAQLEFRLSWRARK